MFGNIKYQSIEVKDLIIEEPYNRMVKKSWCVARAKEESFNKNIFRPIDVSLRDDGKYYVVDGQHRVTMAKIRGITSLFCVVHIGLTYQEEARLFDLLNNEYKKTNPEQSFKALLEAEMPEIVDIKNIVEDIGLYLILDAEEKKVKEKNIEKHNKIRAINALRRSYKILGRELFERALKITKLSWDGHPDSLVRPMLNAITLFIKTYKDDIINDDEIISKFKQVPATTIYLDGKNSAARTTGGNTMKPYARELLRIYNSGRPDPERFPDKFDFTA